MKDELTYVKVEATGFQDLCNRIAELEKENAELRHQAHQEIKELSEENDLLIERNKNLSFERARLARELMNIKSMSMWEFANKYCSSESLEEAGHAFARSLGVGGH